MNTKATTLDEFVKSLTAQQRDAILAQVLPLMIDPGGFLAFRPFDADPEFGHPAGLVWAGSGKSLIVDPEKIPENPETA